MSTQSWQERSLIRDGLLATSRSASAVDLKFPSVVPQTRSWELQIQNRTRIIKLLVLLDSEVRMSAVPRCDANFGIGALVRARDAEFDRFFQRLFHVAAGEQRERVARDRTIMAGPRDRILEGAVLGHQPD